jgi:hypothetical protein
MKKIYKHQIILLQIILLIFFYLPLKASYEGFYVEEEISSTLANKIKNGIKKTYYNKDKAVIIDPESSYKLIFDFTGNKVYQINDIKKTISVLEADANLMSLPGDVFYEYKIDSSRLLIKESGNRRKNEDIELTEIAAYAPRQGIMSHVWVSSDSDPAKSGLYKFLVHSNNILYKKIIQYLNEKKTEDNSIIGFLPVEGETLISRPNEPERYFRTKIKKIEYQNLPEDVFTLPQDYTLVKIEK